MSRLDALKKRAFEEKGFDGFLISNGFNVLYLANAQGAPCLLISRKGEGIIYVYEVNYEQVKAEGKGFRVQLVDRGENLMEKVAAQIKDFGIERLALDSLGVESFNDLARGLRGKAKVKPQGNLIWELRKVKEERELKLMRKAADLTSLGMKVAIETIKPGLREIEVAAEIEYAMRRKGSWGTGFETIVASGVRSAYPHGGCTDRELREGDLVVVDIGAAYQHYCSDMTRTFVAGKPSEKQKRIFKAVKASQEKAHQTIRARARARDVDAKARKLIGDSGYGDYFVHGLGHGVGLEVHEPPTLNWKSKDKLVTGNVVTNEPGIYIVGFGGIRIEDTVLVHDYGAEKLTDGPYTLETER